MKKNGFMLAIFVSIITLIGFVSCTSTQRALLAGLNEKNISNGAYFFDAHYDHYDSSVPVEEQCYLINLAAFTKITSVDGEKARKRFGQDESEATSVNFRNIMILPPGKHILDLLYQQTTSVTSDSSQYTQKYIEARKSLSVELSAGNYYFLVSEKTKDNSGVIFLFDNLEDYPEILVFKTIYSSEKIPSTSIVKGINVKISKIRKFKGFTGGKKSAEKPLSDEEQAVLEALQDLN
jgi:hypothetical protein